MDFEITYHSWTGRPREQVEADSLRSEGVWTVIEAEVQVVGRRRVVVVLRALTDEVAQVCRMSSLRAVGGPSSGATSP